MSAPKITVTLYQYMRGNAYAIRSEVRRNMLIGNFPLEEIWKYESAVLAGADAEQEAKKFVDIRYRGEQS